MPILTAIVPKFAGSLAAMLALFVGIAMNADPMENLQRAGLAFLLGWLSYQVWNAFIVGAAGSFTRVSDVPKASESNTESEQKRAA